MESLWSAGEVVEAQNRRYETAELYRQIEILQRAVIQLQQQVIRLNNTVYKLGA